MSHDQNMLKSEMMKDFEYCTNGVYKLMLLLEELPTIVGLYIPLYYELVMKE